MFNIEQIKKDFIIFNQKFDGKNLVYLDNAATTQKPQQVINAIVEYYTKYCANVSRSSHFLSALAEEKFEGTRQKTADFINAHHTEIIFTKNSTESLNLTAYGWGLQNLKKGDIVLTTAAEHNSSVLPWKHICNSVKANIEYINIDTNGYLTHDWEKSFNSNVKAVVISHASNVLGTVLPVKQIIKEAHKIGAIVVVDGSQVVGHLPVDVKSLDCEFYAFSAHKMLGPTGVGVLYGKKDILQKMNPIYFGGGMVNQTSTETNSLKEIPYKFEAGTPNIAGIIGLGASIDYLNTLGIQNITLHDNALLNNTFGQLNSINNLKILGTAKVEDRVGLVSFIVEGIHSHDIAAVLSSQGIAVRSGMHCSTHLYKNMQLPSSTRLSFSVYNSTKDIDILVAAVKKAIKILS